MDLKQIRYDDVDWVHLAQYKDSGTVNDESSDSIKDGEYVGHLRDDYLIQKNSALWSYLLGK
jgi:hypothetical protein